MSEQQAKPVHTVTIKHDAESHEFEDCHDDCTAEVTCPGVTASCRVWWECGTCRKAREAMDRQARDEYDDDLVETSEAHGVEHAHIDGMWMTAGAGCVAHHLDTDALDLVWEIAEDGEYEVDLDADEGSVHVEAGREPVKVQR